MGSKVEKLKYVDYAESWYKVWCPYCDADNWYCNGNENDITGCDVEAVKCHKCKKLFLLGEPDEILDELRGDGGYIEEDGCKLIKEKAC